MCKYRTCKFCNETWYGIAFTAEQRRFNFQFWVFPCYWYFTNVLKHICLTIYKVLGIGWFNDLIWNFDTKVLDHQRPSTEIDVKRVQLKVIHIHCIIECFYSTRMSRSSQRRQIKYSIERYRERERYIEKIVLIGPWKIRSWSKRLRIILTQSLNRIFFNYAERIWINGIWMSLNNFDVSFILKAYLNNIK